MATPTFSSASSSSSSSNSNLADDNLSPKNGARASGVTRPGEVKTTRQTTARQKRATKGLVHRDALRAVTARNRSETKPRQSPRTGSTETGNETKLVSPSSAGKEAKQTSPHRVETGNKTKRVSPYTVETENETKQQSPNSVNTGYETKRQSPYRAKTGNETKVVSPCSTGNKTKLVSPSSTENETKRQSPYRAKTGNETKVVSPCSTGNKPKLVSPYSTENETKRPSPHKVENGNETKALQGHTQRSGGAGASEGLVAGSEQSAGTIVLTASQDGSAALTASVTDSSRAASPPASRTLVRDQAGGILGTDAADDGGFTVDTDTTAARYLDSAYTKVSNYLETKKNSDIVSQRNRGRHQNYYTKTSNEDQRLSGDFRDEEDCVETLPDGRESNTAELTNLGVIQHFRTRTNFTLGTPADSDAEEQEEQDQRDQFARDSNASASDSGEHPQDFLRSEVQDWVQESGFPGSGAVSTQYRRLESRRGSSVTFILPAHVSSGDNSSQSSSRRQSECEEGTQFQDKYSSLYARRMSAPELPPIADRERHRPPSRSTSKSSLNQLSAAVNNKSIYSRLTNGAGLHRNHSDSSLKGLLAASQGQSSGSVSSYPSQGLGGRGTPGGGDAGLPPPHLHRSSSRALSWCATDNSTGSIPKLETLFERKNTPAIATTNNSTTNNSTLTNNGSMLTVPVTPPPPQVLKNSIHNNNNNNNTSPNNNNAIPPRSVSVNGIRRSDSQELAKIKNRKKKLQSECGAGEIETLATIEAFGRLKTNGMRRSVSDNKLVEKKNVRNARLNTARHLSVSRTDKLTTHRKGSKHATSTVSGTKGLRRVSSTNNVPGNGRGRIDSNQDSENVDALAGGSEDSEEEEERSFRIREWLLGLDCADAPPEPVIEYADDPPQTDTALHVVYKADS